MSIGIVIGGVITFAFQVQAEKTERVTYTAPVEEVIEEVREKTIEEKIREEFADVPTMIEIARCESRFKNVPGELSDDFGPFQVNQVHLGELEKLGLDRENVDDNIKFARILYERNGFRDWKNSQHCWSK